MDEKIKFTPTTCTIAIYQGRVYVSVDDLIQFCRDSVVEQENDMVAATFSELAEHLKTHLLGPLEGLL